MLDVDGRKVGHPPEFGAYVSKYEQFLGFVSQGVSPTALPTPITAIEVLAAMTKLNNNRQPGRAAKVRGHVSDKSIAAIFIDTLKHQEPLELGRDLICEECRMTEKLGSLLGEAENVARRKPLALH